MFFDLPITEVVVLVWVTVLEANTGIVIVWPLIVEETVCVSVMMETA